MGMPPHDNLTSPVLSHLRDALAHVQAADTPPMSEAEARAVYDLCELIHHGIRIRARDPEQPIQLSTNLSEIPEDLLVAIVAALPSHVDIARVDCVSRAFHCGRSMPFPFPPQASAVEQALRLRAVIAQREPPPTRGATQQLLWEEHVALANPPQVVSSGEMHCAFIIGGQLNTCGTETADVEDALGLLGHGIGETRLPMRLAHPTPVPSLQDVRVRSVSASERHTLVLSAAGAVFSFGVGYYGQLGHQHCQEQPSPRAIEALSGVRACAVAAEACHSLVLSEHGHVVMAARLKPMLTAR